MSLVLTEKTHEVAPLAPQDAALLLLDASAAETASVLARVARHQFHHAGITRILAYLRSPEDHSLEVHLDECAFEDPGQSYPTRLFWNESHSVDLFEPTPGLLVGRDSRTPARPTTAIAKVLHADGGPDGLLVVETVEPCDWTHPQAASSLHFLSALFIRSLRRAATIRRQETEAHLMDTLMDHLPDAIYFKDARSRFIRASRQVVVQNGFTGFHELRGKTDFDLFTHEHAAQAFRDEEHVMRTGMPIIAKEEKETWPDGHVTWVLTTKMPFRDRRGEIIGTFGMSRDITQLRQTQAALLESQGMLRQRYQAMQNDLAQARIIQMALLPQAPPEAKQLQIRFRYEPLDAIGGDFFSFRRLPDGGLAVFLGDLTGHGVSAALFMSLIRCMTERVFETDGADPATYVRALDLALHGQIPHGFITAIYCVLEPVANGAVRLTWCGAGHPDPIVWRRATGRSEQIPGGDGAIGIFEDFPREQKDLLLQPGDRVYLYTDGIPETMSPAGEMLGFEEVGRSIEEATRPDLDQTLDNLLRRVRTHRDGAPAEDDIALIGIEIQP